MIKVTLIERSGRAFIEARWIDPITGRKRTRSTETNDRRKAERFAARLEDEIENGTAGRGQVLWSHVRDRYYDEVMFHHAIRTQQKTRTSLGSLQELIDPRHVSSLTTAVVARWAVRMREVGLSPWTIKGYLGDLRKVLRWAHKQDLLAVIPAFTMPRCVDGMKGRPVTTEEFERMLAAVPGVTKKAETAESWKTLLRGLWLSGLRLEEAMQLHWTDERLMSVDLSGRYPMFRIQARGQKNRTFQLLPMTPDFAEFLLATPENRRRSYVFRPAPFGKHPGRPNPDWVGKVISRIGKAAGVKVNETKFASAHDLRRAFGFRWARRVSEQVLLELMRHKDIKTTRDFYIGIDAQATADVVWQLAGNSFGNSGHLQPTPSETPAAAKS